MPSLFDAKDKKIPLADNGAAQRARRYFEQEEERVPAGSIDRRYVRPVTGAVGETTQYPAIPTTDSVTVFGYVGHRTDHNCVPCDIPNAVRSRALIRRKQSLVMRFTAVMRRLARQSD